MQKIKRLVREALWAVRSLTNFPVYFAVRLKLIRSRKVILKFRNGVRYAVRTDTPEPSMVEEIWHRNVYDRLLSFIHDGSTVIDIGGNIGIFSVKAALLGENVRVLGYEPVPGNTAMFRQNVALNRVEDRVKINQLAVSGKSGFFDLYYEERNTGGGSFYPHHEATTRSIKVRGVTLAEIFRDEKIGMCDFLKVDCEGAEDEILFNAPDNVLQRIRTMTIEWHEGMGRSGFQSFRSFLEKAGYEADFDSSTSTVYAWRDEDV